MRVILYLQLSQTYLNLIKKTISLNLKNALNVLEVFKVVYK